MRQIVYVNSLWGDNAFSGDLPTPVKTLSQAIALVYEGGTIVLQTGDAGTSYGSAIFTKNVTVKAAYGAVPYVGTLTFSNAQGLFEGLNFDGLKFGGISQGIVVDNPDLGSVIVRDCRFTDVETAIDLKRVQYVSVHRNNFLGHKAGIKVDVAQEVCLSSNIFNGGSRSVEISTVQRLDLWHNTIYGASTIVAGTSPNQNLRIIYVTLTSFDILYKRIQLPGFAVQGMSGQYEVSVNSVNGPAFQYSVDYTVQAFGSIVSWDGLALQQQLSAGDMIRIMYSEDQDPGGGDAIRVMNVGDENSRIDSNSITGRISDIDIGVFFNTPLKIGYNNFYKNVKWWDGATPTGATGLNNINGDPLYRDPVGSDFHLQYLGISGTSPNIDAADPGRWIDIYSEMGVTSIGGHYTAPVAGIRSNVAPFDRDIDYDFYNRGVTGIVGTTGDIGALEFNQHETALGNYVAERGYDIAQPGTATGPYATLDRGYARAGDSDLFVSTNFVPYQIGVTGIYAVPIAGPSYGRYHSKNIVLSGSDLRVGHTTGNDITYVYSSYPAYETGLVYVGPDSGAGVTGTFGNPYRTITEALTAGSSYVLVRPGFYPSFQGQTGVSLAGVEELSTISLGSQLYSSFVTGSWTGVGTYTTSSSTLTLSDAVDMRSEFSFDRGIDLKCTTSSTSDTLCVGITNDTDSVYAVLDRVTKNSVIGYGVTGPIHYDVYKAYTGPAAFSDVRVHITLEGADFRVTLRNPYINRTYSGTLDSYYTDPWRLFCRTQGVGVTGIVSDIYLMSDLFHGITGVLDTQISRKVFGVLGVTGLNNTRTI